MKTELLAPAKDKETAIAAINCGADAIYIGAPAFGARADAKNSLEDIKTVVDYAHKYYVKVFVTVNTILSDEELQEAVILVKQLDRINVDAILIQDFGLLNELIKLNLSIPIHASTQCDNRTVEKVSFLNSIGFSRVVLARELSLKQIKEIHTANPNLELEAFVHGALCVSYSGQCYLSQYIGKRSANRGECAQPCRKQYSILDEQGNYIAKDIYALCLKDFNASKNIKDMINSGIYSFKIEGRLKDKEYVKNVVSYYRQELDKYSEKSSSGKIIYPFIADTERTFNRGYTNYFLESRKDCFNFISPKSRGKYIGKCFRKNGKLFVETKQELLPQDGLCFISNKKMEGFLINKVEKTDNGYFIYPNRTLNVPNCADIYRNVDTMFKKRLNLPVKRQIGIDVIVKDNRIILTDEDCVTVSLQIPNGDSAKNQEKMNEIFKKQFLKTGDADFYIKKINLESDIPFLPISTVNKLRRDSLELLMQKRLMEYKRNIQKPLKYFDYFQKEADYRANIHNNSAKEFYEKCNAVVKEFSLEKSVPNRQCELMRTKHCIKYALNLCKSPQKLILEDEKGVKYPLLFDCKNCEMAVLTPLN